MERCCRPGPPMPRCSRSMGRTMHRLRHQEQDQDHGKDSGHPRLERNGPLPSPRRPSGKKSARGAAQGMVVIRTPRLAASMFREHSIAIPQNLQHSPGPSGRPIQTSSFTAAHCGVAQHPVALRSRGDEDESPFSRLPLAPAMTATGNSGENLLPQPSSRSVPFSTPCVSERCPDHHSVRMLPQSDEFSGQPLPNQGRKPIGEKSVGATGFEPAT